MSCQLNAPARYVGGDALPLLLRCEDQIGKPGARHALGIVGALCRSRSRGAAEHPRQFAIALDDVARIREPPQHIGQAHITVNRMIALDQSPAFDGELARYEAKIRDQGRVCGRRWRLSRGACASPTRTIGRSILRLWPEYDRAHSTRERHKDAIQVVGREYIKIKAELLAAPAADYLGH